jgi:hypothetical protein
MGMFRDASSQEPEIIKEMAEGLGSTGIRLEEFLEKAADAKQRALHLLSLYHRRTSQVGAPTIGDVNESIREYNALVGQAEDTRRWLLIQREACGFRTHRNVEFFYPIPAKIKLLKT